MKDLATIAENRLQRSILENKESDLINVTKIIKSELNLILQNYLDNVDLKIEPIKEDIYIKFDIEIICKRIKSFGYVL